VEEVKKLGEGVSLEAQTLFNVLSKTLPCAWDGQDIVVNNNIRISEPYTPESCVGNNVPAHALNRIRSIVQNFNQTKRHQLQAVIPPQPQTSNK